MELRIIDRCCIQVGQRFREDYGNIQELAVSIKEDGIIQPLAVKDNGDGTYALLAGGRRMKAIEVAGLKDVPVRIYPPNISDIQMRVIELMENLCRKEMTWHESNQLKTKIHELQTTLHGGKKVSTSQSAAGWSQKDTADLIGVDRSAITRELEMAKAIEMFPQLKQAKSRSDADKMLQKLKVGMVQEEMSKRIQEKQATLPQDRLKLELINKYIIGDFLETVKHIPDKSIDFCEIDPPYAIDLMNVKRIEGESQYEDGAYNEVAKPIYLDFMSRVLHECYRVMCSDSWLVLWFAPEPWMEPLYGLLTECGFNTRRLTGIWNKENGQTIRPDIYMANAYEPFFYARKGNATIVKQGCSNVFTYKPVPATQKIHPTERPIALIEDVLQTFCSPGSRVLVPFLGSGTTMLAAVNKGMSAFGCDLTKEYKDAFAIRVMEGDYGRY